MPNTRWDRPLIVQAIQGRVAKGLPTTTRSVRGHAENLYAAALYHFGSWTKAVTSAGFTVPSRHHRWTRPEVIRTLRRLRQEGNCGTRQLAAESRRIRRDLKGAIRNHLGSMRAARKLLGLPVTRKWTEQRAIAALKKLAQAGNLRYSYLERHTPALLSAVDRLWGGWTAGLKAAGVFASKVDRRKWTRKSILDILKKESRREIHTLKDRYGSGIYPGAIREFGSWGSALRAAGIPVHRT